jgi:hypothetical protein
MLQFTRPPEHAPDDPIVWIAYSDPCWAKDRIEAERKILADAAAPEPPDDQTDEHRAALEARAEAEKRHPVARWRASMLSRDAPLTVPEELRACVGASAVGIEHYWLGEPTQFVIRRLTARALREVNRHLDSPGFVIEVVKRGLDHIMTADKDGDAADKDGDVVKLDPPRDAAGLIVESWIDWLDGQHRYLIDFLGADIYALRLRVGDAEGKP